MGMKRWEVVILSYAKAQMREIKDRRIQNKIIVALRRLAYSPEQQGKQLAEELVEWYSVRAVNQHYRILYHLKEDIGIIFVLSIGMRKEGDKNDIYMQTKKYLRQGLFNLDIEIENIINATCEESVSAIPTEPANSAEDSSLLDATSSSALPDPAKREGF